MAIIAGATIGVLKMEKWVEPFVWEIANTRHTPLAGGPSADQPFSRRLREGWRSPRGIFSKVWPHIVGGIGVGYLFNALLT